MPRATPAAADEARQPQETVVVGALDSLCSLVGVGLLKSAMIPLSFFAARAAGHAQYADPNCLLRLVNVTAPEHYARHPLWSGLAYDDSCADLESFVESQYESTLSKVEFKAFRLTILVFVGLTAATLYRRTCALGVLPVLLKMQRQLLACFFSFSLLFVFMHFSNDCIFMVQLHHSDVSQFTEKYSGSGVDMIPQGWLATFLVTILWLLGALTLLFQRDPLGLLDKAQVDLPVVGSQILLVAVYFKLVLSGTHPAFHALAQPHWQHALPCSFKYKAYHHAFVHHGNGDSFGNSPILDPLFSCFFYAYAHAFNDVFKLTVDTPQAYAFAVAADTLMGLVLVAVVYALFGATHWVYRTDRGITCAAKGVLAAAVTAGSWAFLALTMGVLEDPSTGDLIAPLRFLDVDYQNATVGLLEAARREL